MSKRRTSVPAEQSAPAKVEPLTLEEARALLIKRLGLAADADDTAIRDAANPKSPFAITV